MPKMFLDTSLHRVTRQPHTPPAMLLNLTPEQQQLVRALVSATVQILREESGNIPTEQMYTTFAFSPLAPTIYNHLYDLHQRNEAQRMTEDAMRKGTNAAAFPMVGEMRRPF